MTFAQSEQPDSTNLVPSCTVNPTLSSNNPFRNRAASPRSPVICTTRAPSDSSIRPVSRNPFLDTNTHSQQLFTSERPEMPVTLDKVKATPTQSHSTDFADFFNNLTFDDKSGASSSATNKSSNPNPPAAPPSKSQPAQKREINLSKAPPGHRLTKSQEEALHARRTASSSPKKPQTNGGTNIFADPPNHSRKPNERRPRRNSGSSIHGSSVKNSTSEDEKKRQERRRRERKLRERDEKDPKSRKPNHKLDVIDKLDVTSIYGTGLFHHDGPFDACNPHRNRQGSKRAPMKAFPKDSLNNILGGGGPINKRPDHATFLGNNDEEAFKDYSKGGSSYGEFEIYNNGVDGSGHTRRESNVVSATTRVEPIHGEETPGLGTSTFLEGAPASKTAMQRRKSESPPPENNLSRSKSLAQKFRGINVPRRELTPWIHSPDVSSPDSRTAGTPRVDRRSTDSDDAMKGEESTHAKKDSLVVIVEPDRAPTQNRESGTPRFSSPLDFTTPDVGGEMLSAKSSSGFLNRVKSLKTGPRKIKSSPVES